MNTQKAEPVVSGPVLDIHSTFFSIQGEGPFVGQPAFFIRFAGCNLQCPQCDTEYDFGREKMTIDYVMHLMEHIPEKSLVVITGGEPFRQPEALAELCYELLDREFRIQIETNGTLPPKGLPVVGEVTVVCSPKTPKLNSEMAERTDAFKYVVEFEQTSVIDGLPTSAVLGLEHNRMVARPPKDFDGQIFVQPLDDARRGLHQDTAVKSCLQYGHTLCLQIHKIIGAE